MNYDSLLKVENLSENITYNFGWDSQKFVVKPGQTRLVSFDALVNALGDPRSGPQVTEILPEGGGNPIRIPARPMEIHRLNTLYGIYTDGANHPSFVDHTEQATLADRIPNVRVTSLDDEGEDTAVIFPVEDPDCTKFIPEDQDRSQLAALQRQFEAQRRKMVILEQLVKETTGNAEAEVLGVGTEVTEDTPEPTNRRSRAS